MKKLHLILALPAFAGMLFGCDTTSKTSPLCEEEPCEISSDSNGPDISSSSGISSSVSSSSVFVSPYPPLTEGASGVKLGYATRYWDACKAHCSWSHVTQALGSRCKNCSSNGFTEIAAKDDNKSSCDGGNAYTCFDQIPYVVTDNLAYAFAATPGNGSDCGKCFQLQFLNYGWDGSQQKRIDYATHPAINGKTLIVMSSNVGHDVSGGQFDIMIPAGGVGAFNAFTNQLKGLGLSNISNESLGKQYGGLLSICEEELNPWDWNKTVTLSEWQTCLRNKCDALFNGSSTAIQTMKEGCRFLSDWMMAANNPRLLYKEVTCPQYLIDKYKATMQ